MGSFTRISILIVRISLISAIVLMPYRPPSVCIVCLCAFLAMNSLHFFRFIRSLLSVSEFLLICLVHLVHVVSCRFCSPLHFPHSLPAFHRSYEAALLRTCHQPQVSSWRSLFPPLTSHSQLLIQSLTPRLLVFPLLPARSIVFLAKQPNKINIPTITPNVRHQQRPYSTQREHSMPSTVPPPLS